MEGLAEESSARLDALTKTVQALSARLDELPVKLGSLMRQIGNDVGEAPSGKAAALPPGHHLHSLPEESHRNNGELVVSGVGVL